MSQSIPAATVQRQDADAVQKIDNACLTYRKSTHFRRMVYFLVVVVGLVAAIGAWFYFRPAPISHPGFDKNAMLGVPEVDAEAYGYSALEIDKGYTVYLCGLPANDGQALEFYLTNPEDNTVWLRAEVLNEKGEVLGATGVLKPGEYLPAISLDEPLPERETPVAVHLVGYDPYTWQSRGNVTLNVTIYKDYR